MSHPRHRWRYALRLPTAAWTVARGDLRSPGWPIVSGGVAGGVRETCWHPAIRSGLRGDRVLVPGVKWVRSGEAGASLCCPRSFQRPGAHGGKRGPAPACWGSSHCRVGGSLVGKVTTARPDCRPCKPGHGLGHRGEAARVGGVTSQRRRGYTLRSRPRFGRWARDDSEGNRRPRWGLGRRLGPRLGVSSISGAESTFSGLRSTGG